MSALRGLLLLAALGAAGCTTHMSVGAKSLDYPVSMTRVFYGPEARSIGPAGFDVVKSFKFNVRAWSLPCGGIALGSDHIDISGELNALVKGSGGDAVANLSFVGNDPSHIIPIGNLNYIPPLCFIPAWMTTEVSGDVVKFK